MDSVIDDREDAHAGIVVPFARNWHVITELDALRLLSRGQRWKQLCGRLESCADMLPAWPGLKRARQLCADLRGVIGGQSDDDRLWRATFGAHSTGPLIGVLLDRVLLGRVTNVSQAQELIAALEPEGPEHRLLDAEALGYLLRCCFTAWRQRTAFEELAFLIMAEGRLTPDARAMLVERISCREAT